MDHFKTYRKKPDRVRAIRWDGDNYDQIKATFGAIVSRDGDAILFDLPICEDYIVCNIGDYLMLDRQGNPWVVDDGTFTELYEEV